MKYISFFYLIRNYKTFLESFIILFSFLSHFFLWDLKIKIYSNYYLSYREFLYILIFYFFFNYKIFNLNFFFKIFIFNVIIIFHLLFANFFNLNNLTIYYNLLPLLIVNFIFFICYYLQDKLFKNLELIIIVFLYFFLFTFFFSEYYNLNSNEASRLCKFFSFRIINKLIFLEPSHIGMVIVPFCYYFYLNQKKKYQFHKLLILFILPFVFIGIYSVTLYFSFLVTFILMLVIYPRFFIKNKIFFIVQVLILIIPIFNKSCLFKVNHTVQITDISSLKKQNSISIGSSEAYLKKLEIDKLKNNEIKNIIIQIENKNKLKKNYEKVIQNKINNIEKIYKLEKKNEPVDPRVKKIEKDRLIKFTILSAQDKLPPFQIKSLINKNSHFLLLDNSKKIKDHTTAVLINALTVMYYSFLEKPFGWGFNNYALAFNKYMMTKILPPFEEIYYLNYNDGSNNFIKLIVEFGFFAFIFFFNLLYFIFNKKIAFEQRVLFSAILLTQMARAAGYFNGAFMFCLVMTFVLNYKSFKNE